jgi:hypothetical protein
LEVPVIVQLVLQGAEVWDPDAIEKRSYGDGCGDGEAGASKYGTFFHLPQKEYEP